MMFADDTPIGLRPDEVVELREMLEVLCDGCTTARRRALRRFIFGCSTVEELRADLTRFASSSVAAATSSSTSTSHEPRPTNASTTNPQHGSIAHSPAPVDHPCNGTIGCPASRRDAW